MVADPQVLAFRRRLEAVQAEQHAARVAAFVDYTPVVCGFRLEPLTLRTYTLLLSWGNPFVCGGPVEFAHLVQFIWVHQPDFSQFNQAGRRRVVRLLDRALSPRFPTLNRVCFFLRAMPGWRWCRHLVRADATERRTEAVEECRRLVREALRDFPSPGDDAPPAICALMPQLVALFVRSYGVDFFQAVSLVQQLPLRQLVQYLRESQHRLSLGREKLLTAEEAKVWSDYLGYRNAPASAAPHGSRN